ncbi:MAG: hypothetical protein RIC18_16730 [Hoeflea sp.]|uniref:hypothetical protein n=1 Tax=Hoeflea sp. TaxID=1940281 RepID=UPI0032EBC2EE
MLPEDDYLSLRPARAEHKAIRRIALMALAGCLVLLAALVVQAPAAQKQPLDMKQPAPATQLTRDR